MIRLIFIIIANHIFILIQFPTAIIAYADPSVNITSPISGQEVPVGNLTVFGTSSDDSTTNCQVYVDRNKFAPFQKAAPRNHVTVESEDYSSWTSHLIITSGTRNNLTASIICSGNIFPQFNSSSVNVIGIAEEDGRSSTSEDDVEDMDETVLIEPENGLGDEEECSVMDGDREDKDGDGEDCPNANEPPVPVPQLD